MSEIKVTYFDVNGGRGEPIRIALHAAGKPFTDFRFKFNEFPDIAQTTPFGQVPTVHFGDEQVTQCNALTRYAGKLAGLYPKDDYQALLCDEVMEATEDISYKLVTTFGMEGDELKEARERILQRNIVPHLRWLNQKLEQGGNYLADNQLTVADIKVFVHANWLASSMLDHIPADTVATHAPLVQALVERVKAHPIVAGYYASLESL